jgi:hypothetical protein
MKLNITEVVADEWADDDKCVTPPKREIEDNEEEIFVGDDSDECKSGECDSKSA